MWGGRIRTEQFASGTVEVGANWIHGACAANPIFALANEAEWRSGCRLLRDEDGDMGEMRRSGALYVTPEGRCLDEALAAAVDDVFVRAERSLAAFDPSREDQSILSFLKSVFEEAAEGALSHLGTDDKAAAEAALWGMNNYINFHCGDDTDLCSSREYGAYVDLPGPQNLKVPGGYQNIFKMTREKLGDRVKFNKKVVTVDWSSPSKVTLKYEDGEETEADYAIITCPLGYLKRHHEHMFKPPLSPEKVEAIRKIGFGRSGKVFLEFEAPWWDWGRRGDRMSVLKLSWGRDSALRGSSKTNWTSSILGFDHVQGNDNVLVCWLGGVAVQIMEEKSDDEVKAELTLLLRKCLRNPSLPAPKRVLCTRWVTNPLYLGSYSYGGMQTQSPRHQRALAAPEGQGDDPRLLFAGEATDEEFFSTTHGARRSGIREAERILKANSRRQ